MHWYKIKCEEILTAEKVFLALPKRWILDLRRYFSRNPSIYIVVELSLNKLKDVTRMSSLFWHTLQAIFRIILSIIGDRHPDTFPVSSGNKMLETCWIT
jgi:hypothetical protein